MTVPLPHTAALLPPAQMPSIPEAQLTTPVAFIIFNRPDCTAVSFSRIRAEAPRTLFLIADGPRQDTPGDATLCKMARDWVEQHIDWPCELHRIYAENNMGCALRVSSGLDEVFRVVDRAIILEDDCVADTSFFRFCEELLELNAENHRLFLIAGSNQQFRPFERQYSYIYSRYNHCWGWATWARAWKHYDHSMSNWEKLKASGWPEKFFGNPELARYFTHTLDRVSSGSIDTWDYRWALACWSNDALSILPAVPLIRNIGFDERATHTKSVPRAISSVIARTMSFPLKHPPRMERDVEADKHTESVIYRFPTIRERLQTHLVRKMSRLRGLFVTHTGATKVNPSK